MTERSQLADRLELFHGDAHEAAARVYARLPQDDSTVGTLAGARLAGQLIGPECRFAQTLPATIQFQDRGAGAGGLLAEAVVPDPCFWTPELPFLYRAKIELILSDGKKSVIDERYFGIRRLGTRGRSLYLDGKRWVARGICYERPTVTQILAARAADVALRVRQPDEMDCVAACIYGVPLWIDVRGTPAEIAAEIRRVSRWPAVFGVIVELSPALGDEFRVPGGNLLLAVDISTAATPLPARAQVAVCEAADAKSFARQIAGCPLPVIAVRKLRDAETPLADARKACDRLQYDLAAIGDFAGYFV